MMIVKAIRMMKPCITGSEMKFDRKPSRSSAPIRAATPTAIPNVAVIAAKSLSVAMSPTAAADSAAVADIGPTTRCRELPNAA